MKTSKKISKKTGAMIAAALGSLIGSGASAQTVFTGSGGAAASGAFTAMKTAIGGPDTSTAVGPQASGFRTINWDAVKLDGTDFGGNTTVVDPNHTIIIPVNRFQARGALFADPYAVSGDGFGSVNPATAGRFPAFSPKNTFVMFDASSNSFDDRFIGMSFVTPSNPASPPVEAGTRGFGVMFQDVEDATSTSIEYFGKDSAGNKISLGTFFAPVGATGEQEFLGVLFDNPVVTDVNITVGNKALFNFDGTTFHSFGGQDLANGIDLVTTDDFVFAEPTKALAVPEPSTVAFAVTGLLGGAAVLRRRKRG